MTQARGSGPPMDGQDLDELEMLAHDWAGYGGMPLEALDGYFSALIAGPGPVPMPSEYLADVVGEDNQWASQEQATRALELLMEFWNHIAWRIEQPVPEEDDDSAAALEERMELLPLLALPAPKGDDDEAADDADPSDGIPADFPVGALWASGFIQGMSLRSEGWEQLMLADEDLAADLQDLSRLALVDPRQAEELGEDWASRYDLEERLGLMAAMPGLLQDLYLSRLEQEAGQELAAHEPIRRAPRPGRNDPCPCGSGMKWKKCCGAPTLH
jgi:uncharacterized protein